MTIKKTMYLVIYRDHQRVKTKYFGPFTSETAAEFFQLAIGEPQTELGGFSRVGLIQPFASFEGRTVAQLIKRERENGPAPHAN